jgi:hypothetical protein
VAIVATDIEFFLSGGGTNTLPANSLGGAISTTKITSATVNNLFDQVSGTESAAGATEFRCFYLHNAHATLTLQNARVYISTNTLATDTDIFIALAGEGDNGTAETIAAGGGTGPVGESFTQPTTYTGGLSLGNLAPNHRFAIWVKWVVSTGAAANTADAAIITVQGDTAA